MGRAMKTVGLVLLLIGALSCIRAAHAWVPAIGEDAPGVMTRNFIPMMEIFSGLILIVIGLVVRQFGVRRLSDDARTGKVPGPWWRTLDVIILALFVVSLAAIFRPASMQQPRKALGDPVLRDFRNTVNASGLSITRYDPVTKKPNELQIALEDGNWIVASHSDYPADASDAKDRICFRNQLLRQERYIGNEHQNKGNG